MLDRLAIANFLLNARRIIKEKRCVYVCLFGFLMLKPFARHFTWLAIASFYVYGLDLITMPFLTIEQLVGQHVWPGTKKKKKDFRVNPRYIFRSLRYNKVTSKILYTWISQFNHWILIYELTAYKISFWNKVANKLVYKNVFSKQSMIRNISVRVLTWIISKC